MLNLDPKFEEGAILAGQRESVFRIIPIALPPSAQAEAKAFVSNLLGRLGPVEMNALAGFLVAAYNYGGAKASEDIGKQLQGMGLKVNYSVSNKIVSAK